jgi:16S rRNA processing protein RimM
VNGAEQSGQQDDNREGDGSDRLVTLGRIVGAFGVQGWVKVHSDTDPPENIVRYSNWYLIGPGQTNSRRVDQGKRHGKSVVAKLAGCNDRDAAEQLRGLEIAVRRGQFSDHLAEGEYYWTDLEGMSVITIDGQELGTVAQLFETGSNDVMVVRGDRERLIPYIWDQVVVEVDLAERRIRVNWDPDF